MVQADLLARVASLYYEDNLTQAEISRHVHTSRSTVSRLLRQARDSGIVEITIHYPWRRVLELDGDWGDGAVYEFFIAFDGGRSEAMGPFTG